MNRGLAPLDSNGNSIELHHVDPQRNQSPTMNNQDNLAPVTRQEHAQVDSHRRLGESDSPDTTNRPRCG